MIRDAIIIIVVLLLLLLMISVFGGSLRFTPDRFTQEDKEDFEESSDGIPPQEDGSGENKEEFEDADGMMSSKKPSMLGMPPIPNYTEAFNEAGDAATELMKKMLMNGNTAQTGQVDQFYSGTDVMEDETVETFNSGSGFVTDMVSNMMTNGKKAKKANTSASPPASSAATSVEPFANQGMFASF